MRKDVAESVVYEVRTLIDAAEVYASYAHVTPDEKLDTVLLLVQKAMEAIDIAVDTEYGENDSE